MRGSTGLPSTSMRHGIEGPGELGHEVARLVGRPALAVAITAQHVVFLHRHGCLQGVAGRSFAMPRSRSKTRLTGWPPEKLYWWNPAWAVAVNSTLTLGFCKTTL